MHGPNQLAYKFLVPSICSTLLNSLLCVEIPQREGSSHDGVDVQMYILVDMRDCTILV